MYCHPQAVKQWAKAMKPKATLQQVEQARLMRAAKQAKRAFLARQFDFFERDGSAVTLSAIPSFEESASGRPPASS